MQRVPRRVFSLIKDNAPIAGSAVYNPMLVSQGYGLAFGCMGAGTSQPAERLSKPVLYIVMQGELTIEIYEPKPVHTIVLKPGQIYVRHSGELAATRAAVDCIYMEQSFRDSLDFVENIGFREVIELDDWVKLNGVDSTKRILDGPALFGAITGMPAGTEYCNEIKKGCAVLVCLEGKVELETEAGKKIDMNPWDAVVLRPSRYPLLNIKAKEDCRCLRLVRLY